MILCTGYGTTIVRSLATLTPEPIVRIDGDWKWSAADFELPDGDRFVFAAGYLCGKRLVEQSGMETMTAFSVNCENVMRLCEAALERPSARIVVIGSRSAIDGSYDLSYAVSKAAIHAYAQMRKLGPDQSLTVIAPPIISDSGMTMRRPDLVEVLATRRTVTSLDVAHEVLAALNGAPEDSIRLRLL